MENLNAEQIKKELVLLIDDNPIELHLSHKRTLKFLSFLKSILTVITTDEQKIFELENHLKECENGYEGTLFLDRCKLHDAEEKVKELTEENERLRAQNEVLEITEKDLRFRNKELQKCNEGLAKNIEELEIEGDKVREAYAHYEETTGLKQVRADTVRKMQERLKAYFGTYVLGYKVPLTEAIKAVNQIAKEMVEGINEH